MRRSRGRDEGPAAVSARERLAGILDRLTEGRDAPDFREGAALLGLD
jgi:hypothetical protein